MKKNTYKIYTLGCKVNQYDSAQLNSRLQSIGFELVKKNANYAFVNTCAVTKKAISKDKTMINKAKKESPEAKIILFGCFPKIYKKEAKKLDVDYIFKPNGTKKIIKILTKDIKKQKTLLSKSDRARYFIKIQDGCEQFCTYCIIPYARGKIKSRGETEIISEIKLAIKNRYKEIILSGIHLGLYGKNKNTNLVKLIKKIIYLKNLGRIRLSSIEVGEVNKNMIELMSKTNKICKHLHIPLQSGSDRILKLMNRPYSLKDYEAKIKKIRKSIPKIAISTDVIVGFPGETEKDFLETYNFIKKINFSRLHIFPFSLHEKTPASKLANKVDQKTKQKRAERLRLLGKILEKKYKDRFENKKLEVIIENGKGNKIRGKTEYYFDINFEKSKILSGEPRIKNLIKIKN